MQPFARVTTAAAVLGLYYWFLFANPFPAAPDAAGRRIDDDVAASRTLFEARKFADALPPTERLTQELPGQPIFHERLALIYQTLDRSADAARAWNRFMALSPTPVDACPMVAEAYRRAGDHAQELTALERCASLPPANADFLVNLGQALLTQGREADARRAFERALTVADDYPDAYLLLGVRQFADGEHAAARHNFERFLELAPSRRDEVAVWLQRTAGAK